MKQSILRSIMAVIAAALLICTLVTAAIMEYRSTVQTEQSLVLLAQTLARGYDDGGDDNAQAAEYAGGNQALRVTIVAQDGTVLGDSAVDYRTLPNHADRTEIKEARGAAVGLEVRASTTLGKKQMYAAVRMENGKYLRVSMQYNGALANMVGLLPVLFVGVLIAFLLAMLVANRFAAGIAAPFAAFSQSIRSVQDSGAVLDVTSYPYEELQHMAGDINQMSGKIRQTLGRLEEEHAKIEYILDNMNDGFALLDLQQQVLMMNRNACRILGCEAAQVAGKAVVFATQSAPLLGAVQEVLAGKPFASADITGADKHVYEASVSAVKPGESALETGGAILLLTDVSEKRGAVSLRQRFFEAASHELKTPITSIQGFAELLCSGAEVDEAQKTQMTRRILKETTRMNSLIADIIMISRLESGDILFEREPLDLAHIVREVCEDSMPLAAQAGIALTYDVQSVPLTASHREMSELVGNLVTNALRYNVEGGVVEVSLTNNAGSAQLRVYNTGEPIPEQYRERVFERFYRLNKSRSKASGGTGLGLAIVKHIASGYDANVALQPQENGNVFIVNFANQNPQ